MDVKEILKHVDHTLLTQTATWAQTVWVPAGLSS